MRESQKKKIAFSVDKRGKLLAYVYSRSSASPFGRWFRIPWDEAKLLLSTEAAIEVPYDSQITTTTINREYKPLDEIPMASKRINPGKRRNALERDSEHPIEVTRHYRSGGPGYLSAWQRAAAIGQNELFSTGIKLSSRAAEMRDKRRNPGVTKAAYRSGLKEATAAQLGKLSRIGLRTGHTATKIKADLKATRRFTAEQIARGIEQARAAEKRRNPRRGTRAYLGSTELASKARRMKSARHQLLNDLVRSGEASPKEFNEWSALHHGFNEAATRRMQQLDAKRKRQNPRDAKEYSGPLFDFYKIAIESSPDPSVFFRDWYKLSEMDRIKRVVADMQSKGHLPPGPQRFQIYDFRAGGVRPINKFVTIRGLTQNPSKARRKTKQLYESFSGKRAKRQNVVTAPTGTPGNVAQLGRLRLIQTTDGRRWKFSGNDAPFLAADHKQKLHVVGGRYRANPAGEECGEIERIEYETSKPHLGQKAPAIYFHELGEETGERPTLVIDGDGLIRIEGGEYWIEADGIHN